MRRQINVKNRPDQNEHTYYGRGKLLLSGEYFVLDGASALALPVVVGQSMKVRYSQSFTPVLYWKSFDANGELWFETKFEFWHFDCLNAFPDKTVLFLQKILRQARKQNPHFLRDDVDVFVETNLEFPLEWGLGSSSTLIYNIAQWAYISPFNLLFNIYNGSGYDIAAAQSDCPIIYEKGEIGPKWTLSKFDPTFKDKLFFVYMGNKVDSAKAIKAYRENGAVDLDAVAKLSKITKQMEDAENLQEFNNLVRQHEELVASKLNCQRVKDKFFSDYWGEIKSLGAWGGDFILITSDRSCIDTCSYFEEKGHSVIIPYEQLILSETNKKMVDYHPLEKYLQ